MRDITERKQTEEALRQCEQKFRFLVEEALVGVYIIQNGRFTYVNPMLAQLQQSRPPGLAGRAHRPGPPPARDA